MCHKGAGPMGYLINGPSWWLMVKGERSAGKLCLTMSISGCLPLIHIGMPEKVCTKYSWHDHFIFCRLDLQSTSWPLFKLLFHNSKRTEHPIIALFRPWSMVNVFVDKPKAYILNQGCMLHIWHNQGNGHTSSCNKWPSWLALVRGIYTVIWHSQHLIQSHESRTARHYGKALS